MFIAALLSIDRKKKKQGGGRETNSNISEWTMQKHIVVQSYNKVSHNPTDTKWYLQQLICIY